MRVCAPEELSRAAVKELGLDGDCLDLTCPEAIAEAARRAAGLLAPCPPRAVRQAVLEPLSLVHAGEELTEAVDAAVEALISQRDLLQLPEVGAPPGAPELVYLAPPSFVRRESGACIVLGVARDGSQFLPPDLLAQVERRGHLRVLPASIDAAQELRDVGLVELAMDTWLEAPQAGDPAGAVQKARARLGSSHSTLQADTLTILDPTRPVRYYRGRWRTPKSHTGIFVSRRPQTYGADLWTVVKLEQGRVTASYDLPVDGGPRGCDEAWRLQAAIDAKRGSPQEVEVVDGPTGDALLRFFSPLPAWAQRRLSAVADPNPLPGALNTYRLGQGEIDEELAWLGSAMWLKVVERRREKQR